MISDKFLKLQGTDVSQHESELPPGIGVIMDEQNSKQGQNKNASRPLWCLRLYVLNVQTIFLVKAIGVFDL